MRHIYRLISLIIFLSIASSSFARLYKDDDGYWIISTAEDLTQLAHDNTKWGEKFKQIADIDFKDGSMIPIGLRTVPFSGEYDGQGHTIKNLDIYWDYISDADVAWGLFCYVNGTKANPAKLHNIVLENIHLTRTENSGKSYGDANDVKLGILAGVITHYVNIQNVLIDNCRIDDGCRENETITYKGLFAGGAVGDFASGYGGYANMVLGSNFAFKNIVVTNTKINLNRLAAGTNIDRYQFYLGGIVGRIRSPQIGHIPENVVFSGTLNAKWASEAPIVGNSRLSSFSAQTYRNSYAGEVTNPNVSAGYSTIYDYFGGNTSEFHEFCKKRRFFDYSACNSNTNDFEVVQINAGVPDPNQSYVNGTRTFRPTTTSTALSNTNVKTMAFTQGVNYGYLTDPTTESTDMVIMLQGAVNEDKTYHWAWDGTGFKYIRDFRVDRYRVQIFADNNTGEYVAKLVFKGTKNISEEVPTNIKWYSTTSLTTGEWVHIADKDNNPRITPDRSLYYRVDWTDDQGTVHTSDYFVPMKTVYVFNPATNDLFNADFEASYCNDYTTRYPQAGNDDNNGLTPETAVLTMSRAFDILDAYGDVTTNKIVVMGYYVDDDYLSTESYRTIEGDYAVPTTITGTDNDRISKGTFGMMQTGNIYWYLQAPLRFDNIDISKHWKLADNTTYNSGSLFYVCNYFDITFDENVRFINVGNYPANFGLPENITSVPFVNIVGGTQDSNYDPLVDPILYPSDLYPNKKGMYSEPGITNITVRSACFGRIICCSRNDNEIHATSLNITGSYLVPNRIRLNVDIKGDIDLSDAERQATSYGLNVKYDENTDKVEYISANYSHNIGLIAGGQTDGSAYADVEINVYSGYIGRIINGNITYGRLITQTKDGVTTEIAPSDSYYGRAVINLYGKTFYDEATDTYSSETTVNEVFGGMLGRIGTTTSGCRPYFYGTSEINMYGGYIGPYTGKSNDRGLDKLKKLIPSLYGAGSGGVAGLGDAQNHTTDPFIPYLVDGSIVYQPFDENLKMPVMQMLDGEKIDLNHTNCHVNLYGGVVYGSVYGAGYGESNNIDTYECAGGDLPPDIGALYGDSYITMQKHPDYMPATVLGNVYGSGRGSKKYAEAWNHKMEEENKHLSKEDLEAILDQNPYLGVAFQSGNAKVVLQAGTIGDPVKNTGGDVFGGSKGIATKEDIAALYGSTDLTIDGVTVYGNIYGGSEMANIRKHLGETNSGNTVLAVNSGIIGNNIFGGSKGIDSPDSNSDSKAIIEGSTNVTINGGNFIDNPYINLRMKDYPSLRVDSKGNSINIVDNREYYRTFNIYGGGYMNCKVMGDANLNVYSSLLCSDDSFLPREENPNGLYEHNDSSFHAAYMDITFRNFCVYGGGFGEKTNVRNTNVYVSIPEDRTNVTQPHGSTLSRYLDHQSFFDIAGGGYSGDVGYWVNDKGVDVSEIPMPTLKDAELGELTEEEKQTLLDNHRVKMFDHYVGGKCNVVIDGYTFARKVIGGGFYGSCNYTNTHVRCGSLRQVYGGSLLGYVHNKAQLQFGNRIEDFIETRDDHTYAFNHSGVYNFDGDVSHIQNHDPDIWTAASARAKELNNFIFITENIYGGNDVKGIIGTKKWTSPEGNYGIDKTDNGPLYQTDIEDNEHKGIVFNIYGGTFMGDVYSAGNGHYRGYYVPEWVRYNDGPDRMYRTVKSSIDPNKTGKAYRSRPMVGSVNVNLRGNSVDDFITINGNFFGGGRECSIGQYNTFLPLEDPRRLIQGGHLHVNMGGHVHIDGNVYMGAEGKNYASQAVVPDSIDVTTFNGSTTAALDSLGVAAYDHWYFNTSKNCYVPGYPEPGEVDGNFGMTGKHMFYAYMKNIEMEGDVELTFYRYLYKRDKDGHYIYDIDDEDCDTVRVRKRWVPGELAMSEYNAEDVRMNSFFLGGLCGSMTNNKVMRYDYTDGTAIDEEELKKLLNKYDPSDPSAEPLHDYEDWGAIYRIALPPGVTIRENVVMGSQNAITSIYGYKEGFQSVDEDDEVYKYEGGLVTHSAQAFDLIVYNAEQHPGYNDPDQDSDTERDLPPDFYTDGKYTVGGVNIYDIDEYTTILGETIYRYKYDPDTYYLSDVQVGGHNIGDKRYALAYTYDKEGKKVPYIGRPEKRRTSVTGEGVDAINANKMTVTKLTCKATFDLMGDKSDVNTVYGGNIYGGCYNSGIVIGDAVINASSNLLGDVFTGYDESIFSEYSSLKYNIGRVFGGGFGSNTTNQGDTYVNVLRDFRGMNVFGGGMEGDVKGTANIVYIGNEDVSMIYGAIYGGGLRGAVGIDDASQATNVRLLSGNVRNVYGGSCMGELYGRTFVELYDDDDPKFSHFDYHRFLDAPTYSDLKASRLIAGNVFGGNDIAGTIHYTQPTTKSDPGATPTIEDKFVKYSTGVYIHEKASVDKPRSKNGYNGFPLIGNLYGGSNGAYGVHGTDGKYSSGEIEIATGEGTKPKIINLNGVLQNHSDALDIPNVTKAHIMIAGGSVINGYGGGDMATITEDVRLTLNYPQESMKANAGFESVAELDRVWSVLHFSNSEQREEVSHIDDDGHPIFDFQVFRLFGGNNKADMDIQPDWALSSGYVGSLYSGGNFGKMTYFEAPKPEVPANGSDPAIPAVKAKGLTLTVNSDDVYIDYLYGGGRVGGIAPNIPETVDQDDLDDFYGATLNVERGIIDHVYGGNDVAGYIDYGTNVNLRGAISGDVYCAGNGNYSYKYDRAGELDYSKGTPMICELYEPADDPNYPGQRYFLLPNKVDYKYDSGNADAVTILAINSYRPHVERANLTIAGTEDNSVWVRGKVFCGGNSSSIVPPIEVQKDPMTGETIIDPETDRPILVKKPYDVKFSIGDYVTLNGVFMGSNGESLSMGETILHTERLNAFNGTELNMVSVNNLTTDNVPIADYEVVDHKELYPTTLDLYMRAVEVVDKPADFNFAENITNARIGDFCVGGNRGSMMTNKTISFTFPRNLTIFHSIIGGCMDANVTYKGVTHIGGLTKPLADGYDHKVRLNVKSRFLPLFINYPDEVVNPPISITSNFVDATGKSIMVHKVGGEASEYVIDPSYTGKKYYANGQCNIFGGCYTSGTTVGDIDLHLYSDMLNYDGADVSYSIDKKALADGLVDKSWRSFTVVGGGYGANSAVYGDIHVAMLPEKVGTVVKHPSASTIFGGSQEGLVVGNTTVELRDGKVFANVYGASEAAQMYGSTHVIVGYPKYYKAKKSGIYGINRIDYLSEVANSNIPTPPTGGVIRDEKNKIVVTKSIGYRVGDLVPACLYDCINGRYDVASDFEIGKDPNNKSTDAIEDCFEPVISSIEGIDHIVPDDYGVDWDDIEIWVGDQCSNVDPSKPYYGFGNVYGGGFIPNSSDRTLVGEYTVLRYTEKYRDKEGNYGFGGNTSVMLWDNVENADLTKKIGENSEGSDIKDHVHLATGRFREVDTSKLSDDEKKNPSKIGLFEKATREVDGVSVDAYVYQTEGRMKYGEKYYEKDADGGLYGAGRKVFVEGFTAIDLAYYGYAGHSPQSPKLLNTIQRADMVQVTDCCMELVGASDFTVDEYKDILYAINRVGELRMESSLDYTQPLDSGSVATDATDGLRLHAKKRSRNYMALYNKTNHLAAFRSNWNLDRPYHLSDGSKTSDEDKDGYGYCLADREGYSTLKRYESYVNHKHRYIDFYDKYIAVKRKVDKLDPTKGETIKSLANDILKLQSDYEDYMQEETTNTVNENNPTVEALNDLYNELTDKFEDYFEQRNVATSANMIGISSGYELSIEGLACQRGEKQETRYYGPAYGVTEIKLLTTISDRIGGAYVYALNHHYDPDFDEVPHRDVPAEWCKNFGNGQPTFLQTTGNFVFPGVKYKDDDDAWQHHYIVDDCFHHFDPLNHGYYACDLHDPVITRAPERPGSRTSSHVNEAHEVHYWYITGDTYVYNVTITAFTSDPTTGRPKRDFYFNNDNDLINLSNIKDHNTTITVDEVTWFKHEEEINGDFDCDLSDIEKNYALYLTIDKDTRNTYTTGDGNDAYVLRLPRFTYEYAVNSEGVVVNKYDDVTDHAFGDDLIINPNPAVVNGYKSTNASPNIPRLGLHLVDAQKNRFADEEPEVGQEYFENHLQPDHLLQVKLKTVNPSKTGVGDEKPIYYLINITVKYMMGPAVYGKINIENCALPGEYIYANADDVQVVMDEDLGISKQCWRMYPNDSHGYRYAIKKLPEGADPALKIDAATKQVYIEALPEGKDPELEVDPDTKQVYIPLDKDTYTVPNTDKLVHIPAYLYRNGWELAYYVTANGEEFECVLPYFVQEEQTDSETGKKKLVDTDVPDLENRLQVHNYHRMKPMYNNQVLDLRLVPGARIYIEDDEDMKYYLQYLDQVQGETLPTDSELIRFKTLDGLTVNPRYAEGLDFYQQANVVIPVQTDFEQNNSTLVFKSHYHGNGHHMTIKPDTKVNIEVGEGGGIYNTGFVSELDYSKTNVPDVIFEDNRGTIQNCFYFNTNTIPTGKLTTYDNLGVVKNCYQNTLCDSRFKYNELLKLTTAGFRYGQAAYNLNGFYLDKRNRLLHFGDAPVLNNAPALQARDYEIRLGSVDNASAYDDYAVEYIEKMFNNGDYRYAYYRDRLQMDDIGSQFTEALRKSSVPNYFDYLGQHNNKVSVTEHYTTHDIDEARWCQNHKEYHPLFDTDYLFFGEDLTEDVDENNSNLPELYSPETRVYRVGGFYGTADDKGYFLNKEAYVDSEVMTAIDFVGYRDREMYDQTTGLIIPDVRTDIDADGWIFENSNSRHQVYMPPTLDVPWVGDAETGHIEFDSFDLNPDKVTHNLLIYTHDTDHANDVMKRFHYTILDKELGNTNNTFALHSEDGIMGHHIVEYEDGPHAYGDMMHLVDLHNFNAPVAFKVKEAWYNRKPTSYADEYTITDGNDVDYKCKSAWEGICLPFDVAKTYAASTNNTFMRDMGEITHFYGDDFKGHEYWLRRFKKVESNGEVMLFERPKADNVGSGNDFISDYKYRNTAFHDLYMPYDYNEDHDQLYHYEDPDPSTAYRVMKDYRHLTHNMPYVVAYPGERYYEFDLSGKFYFEKNPQLDFAVPQTICYLANGKADELGGIAGIGNEYVTIPVTDDTPMVTYTDGGYTMAGTFAHVTDNAALNEKLLYQKVDNLYVLDYMAVNGTALSHKGEVFSKQTDVVVPPFRTYVTSTSANSLPAPLRIVDGRSRGIDEIIEEVEPGEDPADNGEDTGIRVWVEGNALMIYTPYDLETNIYNISGQNIRRIRAYEGVNRYTGIPTGFYITLRTKVYIP